MTVATELSVRALLLDMDGTLVDSDAVVERCWRRWAAEHDLDADHVMSVVHGRQGHLSMAILLPERPVEENLAENAAMLAAETADTEGVVEVPGAAAFLAALAGHPHALVTSADRALARTRMAAAGLPMPALAVTAESVSASKPDPEGFLKAAAELGIDPADCLVFEDSGAGIAAARAAGMRVVGVGPRAAAHGPTALVATLEQVRLAPGPDGTVLVRLTA
ncbi:HAD-IA family hydrolase [Kitasatospora sp. NBC_01287]|uniref:HAD-IA family hydrolase n=1 Tax=Kitasatospora sp. NBC_01287 TaxID=2903573 RepID=UPI0022544CFE|nr:HAD-IA family hydrolase [Kitasatospora sp. NBC_01287]MCX4746978.1 HAD-IA family hydrolase [Kitasatospora sp. NBC_01287]